MRVTVLHVCIVAAFAMSTHAQAATYSLPSDNESIIGTLQYSTIDTDDNVTRLQQRFDVGYQAIVNANPHLDLSLELPSGSPLVIPTEHLLPNHSRQGVVINLPEMRMYYYPKDTQAVFTFPIGIGKMGKTIPIVDTSIIRKAENPSWTPPEDIREFNLKQGIVLPKVMPPGPDNPLGPYAIYMRIPTYLIHSTIFPESVGKRASFGCIRMYKGDIEDFFSLVERGEPVAIINTPVKTGWQHDRLYIEAHEPLEEHGNAFDASLKGMVHQVTESTKHQPTLVNWQAIAFIAKERDGIPHDVGMRLK